MMCGPCKEAGSVLQSGQVFAALEDPVETIARMHTRCRYPVSCPCAHRTESQVTSE